MICFSGSRFSLYILRYDKVGVGRSHLAQISDHYGNLWVIKVPCVFYTLYSKTSEMPGTFCPDIKPT